MEKVRIQDDLYMHVNGEWLEGAVIPDDKPTTGGFSDLATGVEDTLMKDFKEMAKGTKVVPNKYLVEAVKLYKKALNIKRRNKDSIKPIMKDLDRIASLESMSDFNKKLKGLYYDGLNLPFNMGVDVDMKDTSHHCVYVLGPSTLLPDTTYYKDEMKAQHDALINLWSTMASSLLKFSGLTDEDQELYLKDTIAFDAIVATLVKSQQDWANYTEIYNPMKTTTVSRLLKPIAFRRLLKKIWADVPNEIIVYDPKFLKGFSTLFNEENFSLYKHWAYVTYLCSNVSYLSEELRTLGSSYRRALMGVKADPTIEKQAYRIAGNYYSEPVGLYYGETYFGEKAKADVTEIVKEIIRTYKKRIEHNDFLSDPTKAKAVVKLNKIEIKMGYPDKVEEVYNKLVVGEKDSLYKACKALDKANLEYHLSKLHETPDRSLWVMPAHMVNACYNPYTNDITFPAAILQAPFYSINQTRSENLGGIGAVIGHEISHAFDNNGANCDEFGNLNNWWTKEDLKAFKKRTKAMIKEFDGIPYMGSKVNGEFVVSENIADNGGMAVTLDIMGSMKDKSYQEYFINWAKVWCMKAREEYMKLLLSIDVHSPAKLRANIQVRNFDEWYTAFNVTSKDEMYIAPKDRVHLW